MQTTETREKPTLSLSYRIYDDGVHDTRISHAGMPHKSEAETANCSICYFIRRKLDRIHKEMFHLVLNHGLFEAKSRPKTREVPVTTEVRLEKIQSDVRPQQPSPGTGHISESPT